MRALVLAVLAGAVTLRLTGADRCWPWRAMDLIADSAPGRPRRRRSQPSHARADGRSLSGQDSRRDGRRGDRRAGRRDGRRGNRRGGRGTGRSGGRREEQLARDLPVVVDLLHLAVTAGHSWHTAVCEVADAHRGPAGRALAVAVGSHRRGERLVDALDRLPELEGTSLRPLTTTLVSAAASGAPLGQPLQRLADAERGRLRRRTEERVRRLPVLLLGPLVGLILPAFVALAIVPVGLTTARVGLEPLEDLTLPPTAASDRSPP